MKIDDNIAKKYNLTEEEIALTMSGYVPLTIKANDFFLKEGQVCNYIGFVKKGLLRSFIYDDYANEITSDFFPENTLIISFDSFNNRVPSKENIKAIEDSELMVISYEKQKELYDKIPAWNLICRDLADFKSREMIERANRFQIMSATERYQAFCNEYPDILQRTTLGSIASYIGVDIATLSRIRKKK
ncbi:MAG: Crp/Fnr family transcriptional regulator [Bacteroidales bacterium]|nr:Crp/Fnr family transcriptional regulator [Bacteroidales bacterium]MBS3777320.1 Crp/Fnr family transcriptional regulator [Bacteroidales bacterium]